MVLDEILLVTRRPQSIDAANEPVGGVGVGNGGGGDGVRCPTSHGAIKHSNRQ